MNYRSVVNILGFILILLGISMFLVLVGHCTTTMIFTITEI